MNDMDDVMNDLDYELISRYIDGELAADEALALRRRLLAEPELRTAYDRMRRADDRVRGAFAGAWAEQVPERISALLAGSSQGGNSQRRAAWGVAVAASVLAAAGLLLNPEWRGGNSGDAELAAVLETTPSGGPQWQELADGRQVRPILSFAHVDGHWCREYLLSRDGATYRGVACRTGGEWVTGVLDTQPAPGGTTEYRPAGADDADSVAAFIAEHGAGIALSRSEEADLIASQWRQQP
jgi:hypothetical protein